MNDFLQAYQANREVLLAQIVQTLAADTRFVAAWLTGSLGRGDADAVSDLDIALVVAADYSETLCAQPAQLRDPTTPERLALFSQFGQPIALHENHHNAPPGGTFTFTLYHPSALMVDWTLIPQAQAQRPAQTRLLFEKTPLPLAPTPDPESLEQRIKQAADTVAFFWMMAAVTAKYIVRGDGVFVAVWLEELERMTRAVARLVAGASWQYQRGSRTQLAPTRAEQATALYQLCDRMLALMPTVAQLGGHVPPSPLATIATLLNLGNTTTPDDFSST